MQNAESVLNLTVLWRGKKYIAEMNCDASLKELGDELQKLTDVKADTMRFIVPQFSSKSSKLLFPFSNEHARLTLREASLDEGWSGWNYGLWLMFGMFGFGEDVVFNEIGREETYLVLKRNDPGLLWLVKSSLEALVY